MKQFFSSQLFSRLIIGIVVAAVVYGVFLAGSPGTQRALQSDQKRVSDLQQISFAIDEYWARNEKLPENLQELQDFRYYTVQFIEDSQTQESYEYQVLGEKQFELCAVFEMDSPADKVPRNVFREQGISFWKHGIGKTCFQLEVQPRISPASTGRP